jgi:hypothetical protein
MSTLIEEKNNNPPQWFSIRINGNNDWVYDVNGVKTTMMAFDLMYTEDVDRMKILEFAKDVGNNKTVTFNVCSWDGGKEVGYNSDTSTFTHRSWSDGYGDRGGWVEVHLDDKRRDVLSKSIMQAYREPLENCVA